MQNSEKAQTSMLKGIETQANENENTLFRSVFAKNGILVPIFSYQSQIHYARNPLVITAHCKECAKDLSDVATQAVSRRQVFDLPVVKVQVSEHQSEHKICSSTMIAKYWLIRKKPTRNLVEN